MSAETAAPLRALREPVEGDRFARFAPRLSGRHSAGYSHFVSLLKIVLPASAVALAMLVLLWPKLNPQQERFRIPKVEVRLEDLENLRMRNPRYVGVDNQKQPFTLTAELATQEAAGTMITWLQKPHGDITLKDGTWIQVEADQGTYDKHAETLDLAGGVTVFHDRGYEIHTERARVHFETSMVEGDAAVRGQGPDMELTGDGFRIEDKGERIFITGKARLMLFPGSGEGFKPIRLVKP
jgi:lipopolysaccharide export system protein LptC